MSYDREKRKRRRQRNLQARSLSEPQFKPKVVPVKKKKKLTEKQILEELYLAQYLHDKDGELDGV